MKTSILTYFLFLYTAIGLPVNSGVPLSNLGGQVDALATHLLRCRRLPGLTISVARATPGGGRQVLTRTYGIADVATNRTVDIHTRFCLAGITQSFTAACLGQLLHENNTFSLDSTIQSLLGGWFQLSNPSRTRRVTVRDILSHRVGLAPYFGGVVLGYNFTRIELIRRLRHIPVMAPFRHSFVPNPLLYVLAGHLVQTINNTFWENVVMRRLFKPLRMTDSTFADRVPNWAANFALPHVLRDGQLVPISSKITGNILRPVGPSNSICSTAPDMAEWMLMLLRNGTSHGDPILDPQVIDEIFQPQNTHLPGTSNRVKGSLPINITTDAYSLGWFTGTYRGRKRVFQNGFANYYGSFVTLFPEEGLGIFTAANGPSLNGMDNAFRALHYSIADLAFGEKIWLNESTICTYPKPWIVPQKMTTPTAGNTTKAPKTPSSEKNESSTTKTTSSNSVLNDGLNATTVNWTQISDLITAVEEKLTTEASTEPNKNLTVATTKTTNQTSEAVGTTEYSSATPNILLNATEDDDDIDPLLQPTPYEIEKVSELDTKTSNGKVTTGITTTARSNQTNINEVQLTSLFQSSILDVEKTIDGVFGVSTFTEKTITKPYKTKIPEENTAKNKTTPKTYISSTSFRQNRTTSIEVPRSSVTVSSVTLPPTPTHRTFTSRKITRLPSTSRINIPSRTFKKTTTTSTTTFTPKVKQIINTTTSTFTPEVKRIRTTTVSTPLTNNNTIGIIRKITKPIKVTTDISSPVTEEAEEEMGTLFDDTFGMRLASTMEESSDTLPVPTTTHEPKKELTTSNRDKQTSTTGVQKSSWSSTTRNLTTQRFKPTQNPLKVKLQASRKASIANKISEQSTSSSRGNFKDKNIVKLEGSGSSWFPSTTQHPRVWPNWYRRTQFRIKTTTQPQISALDELVMKLVTSTTATQTKEPEGFDSFILNNPFRKSEELTTIESKIDKLFPDFYSDVSTTIKPQDLLLEELETLPPPPHASTILTSGQFPVLEGTPNPFKHHTQKGGNNLGFQFPQSFWSTSHMTITTPSLPMPKRQRFLLSSKRRLTGRRPSRRSTINFESFTTQTPIQDAITETLVKFGVRLTRHHRNRRNLKVQMNAFPDHVGTYHNQFFGNVVIFYNSTSGTLQMEYGFYGKAHLIPYAQSNTFLLRFFSAVWYVSESDESKRLPRSVFLVQFKGSTSEGHPERFIVPFFDPRMPPTFVRVKNKK